MVLPCTVELSPTAKQIEVDAQAMPAMFSMPVGKL
jgi:hypothetical protein